MSMIIIVFNYFLNTSFGPGKILFVNNFFIIFKGILNHY